MGIQPNGGLLDRLSRLRGDWTGVGRGQTQEKLSVRNPPLSMECSRSARNPGGSSTHRGPAPQRRRGHRRSPGLPRTSEHAAKRLHGVSHRPLIALSPAGFANENRVKLKRSRLGTPFVGPWSPQAALTPTAPASFPGLAHPVLSQWPKLRSCLRLVARLWVARRQNGSQGHPAQWWHRRTTPGP